eukprot:2096412-Rhodomonas_salina.2
MRSVKQRVIINKTAPLIGDEIVNPMCFNTPCWWRRSRGSLTTGSGGSNLTRNHPSLASHSDRTV